MPFYKAETVREAARGQWLQIIATLAPHAEAALKRPGKHVACPVHGGKDGFRVFKKDFLATGGGVCNSCGTYHDGFELLMWLNNRSFSDTLSDVAELMGVEPEKQKRDKHNAYAAAKRGDVKGAAPVNNGEAKVVPMTDPSKAWMEEVMEKQKLAEERQKAYSKNVSGKIDKIWHSAGKMSQSDADAMRGYLVNRRLTMRWNQWLHVEDSDCIRFAPSLPYYDSEGTKVGDFPAIVCAIRDVTGALVTLHRIYLTKSGKKARLPEPKKMMPVPDDRSVTGAAIRLGEPDGVLGVAEGVETALAAFTATQIPVWATVNATLMQSLVIPTGVHTVIIWADKDKSKTGEASADVLKHRLEAAGVKVVVMVPKLPVPKRAKGIDWNDVLVGQGKLGFPSFKRIMASLDQTCLGT